MRYRKTEIWKSVDWITILLYLIMVIAGWFSICGASYEFITDVVKNKEKDKPLAELQ